MSRFHVRAGSAGEGSDPLVITPESAGWRFCGLRVVHLAPGETRALSTRDDEVAVVPLSGSCSVEVDGRERLELEGRNSVFARVTDWAYVPIASSLRLTSVDGCELALASARAQRRFRVARVPAEAARVEVRGAGPATRQITNFMAPEVFAGADRLVCVEVLTPDGNWSSYPPHKHDDTPGSLSNNEEIYYFRVGRTGGTTTAPEGFALHRTYTADGSVDDTVVVRDGDAYLIPRGYHGPCIAAPGYPLYYLNVLAGPDPVRSIAFADDPLHAWVRGSWEEIEPDPRCPMTTPTGPA